METTTIIMLIGIALAAFNGLVVIACVVKSARINQRVVEEDSLKPAWTVQLSAHDLENGDDSLELAA